MKRVSDFLNTIATAIYNDRTTIYAIGFGVGWTACNLCHDNLSAVPADVGVTIFFVWATNIMSRKRSK